MCTDWRHRGFESSLIAWTRGKQGFTWPMKIASPSSGVRRNCCFIWMRIHTHTGKWVGRHVSQLLHSQMPAQSTLGLMSFPGLLNTAEKISKSKSLKLLPPNLNTNTNFWPKLIKILLRMGPKNTKFWPKTQGGIGQNLVKTGKSWLDSGLILP